MAKSLLLGCGNSREKKVRFKDSPFWTGELVTLDMDPNCGATVIWNLDHRPLPFLDEEFDEIAAYDVLEHQGRQGDWAGWFDEFTEYWRILKPGGLFGIIVPQGEDALVDPGHTRFIHMNWFAMLDPQYYEDMHAKGLPCTDYRFAWKHRFEVLSAEKVENHHLGVILRKA